MTTVIPSETVEGITAVKERGPDAIRRTLAMIRTGIRTRTGIRIRAGDSRMADGKISGKTDNHKERPI